MIVRTVKYTRPIADIDFYRPNETQKIYAQNYRNTHGIIDIIEFPSTFELVTTLSFPDQDTYDAFYSDEELNKQRADRDNYNSINGISKTIVNNV